MPAPSLRSPFNVAARFYSQNRRRASLPSSRSPCARATDEMRRPRIAPRPFCVTETSRRALTTHWHSMLGDGAESSQRAGGGSRTTQACTPSVVSALRLPFRHTRTLHDTWRFRHIDAGSRRAASLASHDEAGHGHERNRAIAGREQRNAVRSSFNSATSPRRRDASTSLCVTG